MHRRIFILFLGYLSVSHGANSTAWTCPDFSQAFPTQPATTAQRSSLLSGSSVSCTCELAHTLRCDGHVKSGKREARAVLQKITNKIRSLAETEAVTLLDISIQNITFLPSKLFQEVDVRGLVISTGSLSDISPKAFAGLESRLTALGLPGNALVELPVGPIASLTGLTRLDLSSNLLTAVHSLPALSDLEYLDLSRNKISLLASGLLQPLPNIKFLALSENQLTSSAISYYNLQHLSYLHTLDLARNRISGYIRSPIFDLFPSNLKLLDLSFNSLTGIAPNSFQSMSSLTQLVLQGNNIQEVGDLSFVGLSRLQSLDLSHNSILTLSDQSFSGLLSLQELALSHNHLQVLSGGWISSLPSLSSLQIMDNEITSVESGALDGLNLTHLSLGGNPFNCDCSLTYFHSWLQAITQPSSSSPSSSSLLSEDGRESPTCTTPPSLNNAPLVLVPAPLECNSNSNNMESSSNSHNSRNDSKVHEMEYYEYYTESGFSPLATDSGIHLSDSHYSPDTETLTLVWRVDDVIIPYTCSYIHIFQERESGADLVGNSTLPCRSQREEQEGQEQGQEQEGSEWLKTVIHLADYGMQRDTPYIICVSVAHETGQVPGCSGSISVSDPQQNPTKETDVVFHGLEQQSRVSLLSANVSADFSSVTVTLHTTLPRAASRQNCRVHVGVSAALPDSNDDMSTGSLLGLVTANCSVSEVVFQNLERKEVYRICAIIQMESGNTSLDKAEKRLEGKPEDCILAITPRIRYQDKSVLPLLLTLIFLALGIACLTVLYLIVRRGRAGSRRNTDQGRPGRLTVCWSNLWRKAGMAGSHAFLRQHDPDLIE